MVLIIIVSHPRLGLKTVITLTNQNFNSKMKEYDVLLVMFYVKWCSHCRRLHPDYEQAGTKLSENADSSIYLAKLDCTDNSKAQCTRRYGIDGYPTLRIYRYGRFIGEELNDLNRTTDEIVKTMKALKKNSEQQGQTWYISDQTDGVKDEVNKASISVQSMWSFVLLFMGLYNHI
jgi:thioredoxin-like negative regulator of GroEL